MIDQTAPLNELPEYWQEQIRELRSENHELRSRLRADGISFAPKLNELPSRTQKYITDLRKDCSRFRHERNEARAELAALRAERA